MSKTHPIGNTPQFTLRLDQDTRSALEKEAFAENRSLGNHIKTILAQHVGYDGPLEETSENQDHTTPMKKRAHVMMDAKLFADASAYARDVLYTDFSALVIRLLVEELDKRRVVERMASPSDRILQELIRRVGGAPLSTEVSSPLEQIERERREQLPRPTETGASHGGGGIRPTTGQDGRGAKGRGRR